ncbi:MAG: tetratricopeptide repeat protein [Desulfonatronovibrionaceae bacterium]
MNNTMINPGFVRKSTALVSMICLAAILAVSLIDRIQDPGITVQTGSGPSQQEQAMMSQLTELMTEVERNPDNVQALTELAHIFMLMEAWERSLNFWERVLALEPEDPMALNQAGFCLFQLERHEEAVTYFEKLLDIDPENYHSHFNLGIIFKYYLNDQDRAEKHFQAVLDISPDDPAFLDRVRQELQAAPAEEE